MNFFENEGRSRSAKLGVEKPMPAEQNHSIIEAAREAECHEDEAAFDATMNKIAKPDDRQA